MITIALNNYINIDPKYYLNRYIFPIQNNSLTFEEFKDILVFCSKGSQIALNIVGGEPTLHPDFQKMLIELNKYCLDNDTYVFIHTNGTNLEQYLAYIGDRIYIVVDYITTETQNIDYFEEQKKFLDRAYNLSWFDNKCFMQFNLYPELENDDFIWECVKTYKLKQIQLSIAMPSDEQVKNKIAYYHQMKDILTKVCYNAIQNQCKVILLENYNVPFCFLTEEQYAIISQATGIIKLEDMDMPNMEIVIYPDLKTSIPTKHSMAVDYTLFDNPKQLIEYISHEIFYPTLVQNRRELCSSCQRAALYKCQGGNLKFANV